MRAVAEAAAAAGREVVVVGRAMERVEQVARETGYLDGIAEFRSVEAYGYLPPDKVVALCTGSQGEPRAALARISEDQHPEVTLSQGDTVIFSSRTIPGNEKAVGKRDQRAGAPGHRGHHRPHASGARLRPSAPRRDGGALSAGCARGSRFRCTARRCISPSTPSSRATPASPRSFCAATAIWCGSRPTRRADRRGAGRAALQGRRAADFGGGDARSPTGGA